MLVISVLKVEAPLGLPMPLQTSKVRVGSCSTDRSVINSSREGSTALGGIAISARGSRMRRRMTEASCRRRAVEGERPLAEEFASFRQRRAGLAGFLGEFPAFLLLAVERREIEVDEADVFQRIPRIADQDGLAIVDGQRDLVLLRLGVLAATHFGQCVAGGVESFELNHLDVGDAGCVVRVSRRRRHGLGAEGAAARHRRRGGHGRDRGKDGRRRRHARAGEVRGGIGPRDQRQVAGRQSEGEEKSTAATARGRAERAPDSTGAAGRGVLRISSLLAIDGTAVGTSMPDGRRHRGIPSRHHGVSHATGCVEHRVESRSGRRISCPAACANRYSIGEQSEGAHS